MAMGGIIKLEIYLEGRLGKTQWLIEYGLGCKEKRSKIMKISDLDKWRNNNSICEDLQHQENDSYAGWGKEFKVVNSDL